MKPSVRPVLAAAVAFALLGLAPLAVSPAYALPPVEIILNSSNVQVVHNPSSNTDVLNMSLNVTTKGDTGPCDSEEDDLLETGFFVAVARTSCAAFFSSCFLTLTCPDFFAEVGYVEHDIGSSSYGTSFGPNAAGSLSSKIVALATPPNTCGTWSINLQATGQNLSAITSPPVSLFLEDADSDSGPFLGAECFDVNANIGNGITKPHHGVHHARH
jgi:hypothetical protein